MAKPALDAAIAFLQRVLAKGPMRTVDLLRMGEDEESLSKSTMKRARHAIGAVSVKRGDGWWSVLEKVPEPRKRSRGGEPGTVSMSTILDRAALDQHRYLREFEEWMKPQTSNRSVRGPWTTERRAAIIGFVARSGSIDGAARFTGISPSTARQWLDRGEKDEQQLAEDLEAGRDSAPTQHCIFRRDYLRAMGWLSGRLWGVVTDSALQGSVGDAKWCLTMQHGVRQRIEVDHNPAIEVDEQQRRDDLLATMMEYRARRKALAETDS